MVNIRRVSPLEAKQLVDEGYTYVDVRTVEEFDVRHAEGAFNVPLTRIGRAGAEPNPDFLPIMRRLFVEDSKIVVGCATGTRSLRAAAMLVEAGFRGVVEQRAGLEGTRDPFGRLQEPGWASAGLPMAKGADRGSYDRIKARVAG